MKRTNKFIWILSLILISMSLLAQQNTDPSQLSLDGSWEIIFDDKNEGVENAWHINKNYETHQRKREIEVPSCWEEFEKNYEGVAFYRKKFTLPESWEGQIIDLKFEASNYMTQVWLNEQVVGFHEGGYTPFSFRIDKLTKPGEENTLTVRVISPIILADKRIDGLGRQEVPMWRGAITGGIWQSVSIEASGSVRFTDVFLEPNIHNNTATSNIEIENVETGISNSEVSIKILSKDGKQVATQKVEVEVQPGKNHLKYELKIPDAEYWSMGNPYLYKAEIEINTNGMVSDEWSAKFGMREFSVKDDKFTLNGKSMYLKACFFEGLYPVKLAYPDSKEMAIKEITLAKEAGFNMIRPWRKPAPPMWLDLCDSIGVLTVGSLVTECMHRPISTPRLPFVVENEVRKTILANRNRTCIVQWELFNEINRPILAQMLNSMSLLARELDPTRMILDESGGWGEGANVYLPYQRTPIKFNDIHHYSGSQIHEKEYNGYLAIAKTKKEIEEYKLGDAKGYGKNVLTGKMSYVSELGYGSSPDLSINNLLFEEKGNPIVSPTIYHKKMENEAKIALEKTGFNKIYPNIQEFYLEQQKMHGIANKRIIEATRSNSSIAGYCVHALVGGDWVIGAGLLDLWRNPKTLVYDLTKAASQEQIVAIRILPRNIYAEKGGKLEITGISELETEAANISIKIKSEKGKTVYSKTLNQDFEHGISKLFKDDLQTEKLKGNYSVEVRVTDKLGKLITANSQPFDVFIQKQLVAPKTKIAVVDPANTLVPFLKNRNIEFVQFSSETDKNTVVIVGQANLKNPKYKQQVEAVKEFVKKGGYAVLLEVPGKPIKRLHIGGELNEVKPDALPFGAELHSPWVTLGGWAGKPHIVTDHPVFKGLPTEMIMYGVYENVHPKTSMSKQKGKYIAGLIGYDHFPKMDIMIRHYNGPGETWWAADVLEAEIGNGKMLLSTLDILSHLGKDPVAEKILYNMINFASK
ncbi:MAG: beta galactosidase jelly roll domain-containing protein [Bacteroidetes bacterium]|nr:beta galactosidase jelly roll domain-containing protein [Bacteroidota bacterium]